MAETSKAKEVSTKKKTTTVSLYVTNYGSSTIVRSGGMPMIIDQTDKALEWLKAHEYKASDIEIIGEKPSCWDTIYPSEEPTFVRSTPMEEVPAQAEPV